MIADHIQTVGVSIAAILLAASMVCAAIRILRGPGGPDRVLALDLISLLGVAVTGLAVMISGSTAFIDIALGVALVGFLATVAFASFIERGSIDEEEQ